MPLTITLSAGVFIQAVEASWEPHDTSLADPTVEIHAKLTRQADGGGVAHLTAIDGSVAFNAGIIEEIEAILAVQADCGGVAVETGEY